MVRTPPPLQGKPQSLYEKPKNLRDVPRYLKQVIGGFFSRLFYIIALVWETKPSLLILMSILCVAVGILPLIGALINKELLNAISDVIMVGGVPLDESLLSSVTGTLATVAVFVLMQFGYQFMNRIASRIQNTVQHLAGERVSAHIRMKLMKQAKTVDLASFDRPAFYEKLENANREAGMRPVQILLATFTLISSCISAVSFVVVLVTVGWYIPLIVALLAIPVALVNYKWRNRHFWYMRRNSKSRRQMNYYSDVVTDKDLAKELRLMNLSDTFIDKYEKTFDGYYRGMRRLTIKECFWQIVTSLLTVAAEAVLFFYIGYHVVSGGMEIGDYSLLAGALTSVGAYVTNILNVTATVYEGTLFIDNVMTFMKEKPTVVAATETPVPVTRHTAHTVTFEHVSFRYPGTNRDVICDLSTTMHTGESVVLVGLNGAGKTTLIKLLTRLYDPTEGRILLDGVDIREYDPQEYYRLFGTVFQDFGRYALTIEENITLGNTAEPPDAARAKTAAQMGNATGFIDRLEGGMATPLMRYFEENGHELSGGEWQKLSIARAFYADPDILILDEPTASLDPLAEQDVFERFAALGREKLTILVSHRLSGAVQADRILVIENGRLIETGTHEELVALNGKYHHLFTTQAKHYIDPPDRDAPENMPSLRPINHEENM